MIDSLNSVKIFILFDKLKSEILLFPVNSGQEKLMTGGMSIIIMFFTEFSLKISRNACLGFWQTSLLCIMGGLAREGCVAVVYINDVALCVNVYKER